MLMNRRSFAAISLVFVVLRRWCVRVVDERVLSGHSSSPKLVCPSADALHDGGADERSNRESLSIHSPAEGVSSATSATAAPHS